MDEVLTRQQRAWAANAIARVRQNGAGVPRKRKGLLIVHLDGVPKRLLDAAVESGSMPFLSRLVQSGHHRMEQQFWGSPASTPCFQAGLLYGLRHPDLPAYEWFDRKLGRKVRMNIPPDTRAIEDRLELSRRDSLLDGGGTTYLSLFRGDADNQMCMSALSDLKALARTAPRELSGLRGPQRRTALEFFAHTVNEVAHSVADVAHWVTKVGDRRHEREYLVNRFFLIHLAWNLARTRALIDMIQGVPVIYLVFGNYDEVSHRRGPFSKQSIRELHRVDHDLGELYAVGQALEPQVDLVLVTDHGHVDSSPFERRQKVRLEKYLLEGPPAQLSADAERALLDGRALSFDPSEPDETPVVVESGNFSHVYLTRGERPLEAAELLAHHRGVLSRAASHRDIGIVALRRGDEALALIAGQPFTADELHRAPLPDEFSRQAVADLLRELPSMPTAGDLVLYGQRVSHTGTVGFAWEFGSHGGLTHIETDSTLVWPAAAPVELSGLTHASQLHTKLSEIYRH